MARKVIWTHSVTEDLEVIAEYLHQDSPGYAIAFVHRAMEAGRSLCDFAERGRMAPEFDDKNLREIFIQSYRLIYRIEGDRVYILALIHGRRDLRTVWDKREA